VKAEDIYPSCYDIYICKYIYISIRVAVSMCSFWKCYGMMWMEHVCSATCHDMDVKIHQRLVNSWANDGVSA
jgi:hypothetical protein